MSRLVQLTEGCFIDPDLVAEVKLLSNANSIIVRMHDGTQHSVPPVYGDSVHATMRSLIALLNLGRTKCPQ